MHVKKYFGILLIPLGIFWLLISLVTLSTTYSDPRVHPVAFFISILSVVSIIGGILLHRSGNKEIREAKEQLERENQVEANLDKDRRIKELEKRLEKIENDKSKSQNDSSSQNKNHQDQV